MGIGLQVSDDEESDTEDSQEPEETSKCSEDEITRLRREVR